jgi:FtsP/CotA-like multicopper oxidase with cupredoxin domain
LWGSAGLGSTLKKAKFVAYTDGTFSTKVEIPADEIHLGLLGPLIRASPGDQIEVVLKNNVTIDLLLDPQGLIPVNLNDAASPLGEVAKPGETITYTWDVPAEAAPGPGDPDTKLYLYRSVVYSEASDNAGLIGPILVSRQDAPAKPDQGRDIITIMQIQNENVSPYYDVNLGNKTYESLGLESEYALEESLLKHVINGYVFCNAPGLNMTQNEKVRWHSAAMGSEGDIHNSHWHGSTFLHNGNRGDQVKMFPGTTLSLDFTPREPGTWLLHCHVNDHIHAGMMALYNVAPDAEAVKEAASTNGTVRKYFIAVDEVDWK